MRASHLIALLCIAALALAGVAAIYSAGYVSSDYPVRPNWLRQCAFLGAGALVAAFFARLDCHRRRWRLLVLCCYGASVLLLVAVLFIGRSIGGARRWLAVGPLLLQPAEFAKVFTLLAGAVVLSGELFRSRLCELAAALAVFAVPMLLIAREPSYGNAASLLPGMAVMIGLRFLPGWLWKAALVVLLAAFFAGIGALHYLRSIPADDAATAASRTAGAPSDGILHGYHLRRLNSYLSARGGWNEQQSLMTVAGGGLLGKGYLKGTMKSLGFLPRTVAPTDFIFAVIAEEGGFLGGVLPVVTLYGVLVAVLLHLASRAASRQDLNLLAGGVSLLMIHICVGIGMTIRMLPVIGLPLPLLSYGGSFTLSMMILLGCMMGCDRTPPPGVIPADRDLPLTLRLGALFRLRIWRKDPS